MVVGGGIAGILSAFHLKGKFEEVFLVEKQDNIGGLLNSFSPEKGLCFDFGSHVLAQTGISDIDELLFDECIDNESLWNKIPSMKVGNFFRGQMDNEGPCIDARLLDEEIYEQGLIEFIKALPKDSFDNLKIQLIEMYGETFAKEIFEPIVHKLFGVSAELLSPNSYELFVPKRIKLLNNEITKELKKLMLFDDRMAFHTHSDSRIHFYPKTGGMGQWIKGLYEKLINTGVKILTNEQVEIIQHRNGKVEMVQLSQCQIPVEQLVWTIPPIMLLKAANISSLSQAPQFRKVKLMHFVLDRPFNSQNAYINCYDSSYRSFRITLYPNLSGNYDLHKCTVEILYTEFTDADEEIILDELMKMGIVPKDTKILKAYQIDVNVGFPIRTNQYNKLLQSQNDLINNEFNNVLLLGKSSGTSFYMNEILQETYIKVQHLIKDISQSEREVLL